MNGDVSNLDGIIATQSDYEKYIDSHHIMLMFFKRELIFGSCLGFCLRTIQTIKSKNILIFTFSIAGSALVFGGMFAFSTVNEL